MQHFSQLSSDVNAALAWTMTRPTEETIRLPAWPPSGGNMLERIDGLLLLLFLFVNQFLTSPPSPSLTKRFRPLLEGNRLANKIYYCEWMYKWMKWNNKINDSTFSLFFPFTMARVGQIWPESKCYKYCAVSICNRQYLRVIAKINHSCNN